MNRSSIEKQSEIQRLLDDIDRQRGVLDHRAYDLIQALAKAKARQKNHGLRIVK